MVFPAGGQGVDRFIPGSNAIEIPAVPVGHNPGILRLVPNVDPSGSGEPVTHRVERAFAPAHQSPMPAGPLKLAGMPGSAPPAQPPRPPAASGMPENDPSGYQIFCVKCGKWVATIPVELAVSQMVPPVVCADCLKPPSIAEGIKTIQKNTDTDTDLVREILKILTGKRAVPDPNRDVFEEFKPLIKEVMRDLNAAVRKEAPTDDGKALRFKILELTEECEALARTIARLQNEVDRLRGAK